MDNLNMLGCPYLFFWQVLVLTSFLCFEFISEEQPSKSAFAQIEKRKQEDIMGFSIHSCCFV